MENQSTGAMLIKSALILAPDIGFMRVTISWLTEAFQRTGFSNSVCDADIADTPAKTP
jgi:hypothetical protein